MAAFKSITIARDKVIAQQAELIELLKAQNRGLEQGAKMMREERDTWRMVADDLLMTLDPNVESRIGKLVAIALRGGVRDASAPDKETK